MMDDDELKMMKKRHDVSVGSAAVESGDLTLEIRKPHNQTKIDIFNEITRQLINSGVHHSQLKGSVDKFHKDFIIKVVTDCYKVLKDAAIPSDYAMYFAWGIINYKNDCMDVHNKIYDV